MEQQQQHHRSKSPRRFGYHTAPLSSRRTDASTASSSSASASASLPSSINEESPQMTRDRRRQNDCCYTPPQRNARSVSPSPSRKRTTHDHHYHPPLSEIGTIQKFISEEPVDVENENENDVSYEDYKLHRLKFYQDEIEPKIESVYSSVSTRGGFVMDCLTKERGRFDNRNNVIRLIVMANTLIVVVQQIAFSSSQSTTASKIGMASIAIVAVIINTIIHILSKQQKTLQLNVEALGHCHRELMSIKTMIDSEYQLIVSQEASRDEMIGFAVEVINALGNATSKASRAMANTEYNKDWLHCMENEPSDRGMILDVAMISKDRSKRSPTTMPKKMMMIGGGGVRPKFTRSRALIRSRVVEEQRKRRRKKRGDGDGDEEEDEMTASLSSCENGTYESSSSSSNNSNNSNGDEH